MTLFDMLHNGSGWVLLVCVLMVVGVVIGLFTESGSGIAEHPFSKPGSGGALGSDQPAESLGRAELEPILWRRRRRRAR